MTSKETEDINYNWKKKVDYAQVNNALNINIMRKEKTIKKMQKKNDDLYQQLEGKLHSFLSIQKRVLILTL